MANEDATKAPEKKRFRLSLPARLSLLEIAVVLLILNLFVIGGLLWRVESNKPPVIATVGVTQLSRIYSQQFASDPANSPEMISLKTRIFMATTEKLVGQMARQKGMVVFARECVLTGDHVDLTPEITSAVDQALKSGQLPVREVMDGPLSIRP
jgi:hypothetical protein